MVWNSVTIVVLLQRDPFGKFPGFFLNSTSIPLDEYIKKVASIGCITLQRKLGMPAVLMYSYWYNYRTREMSCFCSFFLFFFFVIY